MKSSDQGGGQRERDKPKLEQIGSLFGWVLEP